LDPTDQVTYIHAKHTNVTEGGPCSNPAEEQGFSILSLHEVIKPVNSTFHAPWQATQQTDASQTRTLAMPPLKAALGQLASMWLRGYSIMDVRLLCHYSTCVGGCVNWKSEYCIPVSDEGVGSPCQVRTLPCCQCRRLSAQVIN